MSDQFKRTGGGHDAHAIFGRCHSCTAPVEDPIDAPFCPTCKEASENIFPVGYKHNTSARLDAQRTGQLKKDQTRAKQLKIQAEEG